MGNGTRVPPEAMGYTTRGKGWEWRQSWYLLGFLTWYFYWVPMLYTGVRVVQAKWILWSVIYGIPGVVSLLMNVSTSGAGYFIDRWMYACYVIALIHTLVARGEFLVRLQSMQDEREELMREACLKAELAEQARLEQTGSRLRLDQTGSQQSLAAKPAYKRLDINTISEREIALLPGMGPERARQVTTLREGLGSFRSFDHFAEKMGLGGDMRAKLRPLFEDPDAPPPPPTLAMSDPAVREMLDGRRVLELNLADAESIAGLPGLNPATAARAVALREADGPYKSLEDFRYRVGLSMDVIVQISPLVSTARTRKPPADGVKPSGRVLDV